MFTWVNYEDLGGKKEKKSKNASIWVSIMSFSPQIGERGDLFPLRKYLNSSIFLPTSVNHTQDLMCFKSRLSIRQIK